MNQSHPIDLGSLSPIERIALAEALYDSAMREIDAAPLPPEQLAELDRRIIQIENGEAKQVSCDSALGRRVRAA